MNELRTAYSIRNILDEGAGALDSAQCERLAQARARALVSMPVQDTRIHGLVAMPGARARPAAAVQTNERRAGRRRQRAQRESLPWLARLALTAAPIALVAVGAFALTQWSDEQRLVAMAELDKAVLLDDVPLAGYADSGFGVFLKHTDQ
ncbi:MAG: DUF3619 family protein [Burkholderiaceae bacterium]